MTPSCAQLSAPRLNKGADAAPVHVGNTADIRVIRQEVEKEVWGAASLHADGPTHDSQTALPLKRPSDFAAPIAWHLTIGSSAKNPRQP